MLYLMRNIIKNEFKRKTQMILIKQNLRNFCENKNNSNTCVDKTGAEDVVNVFYVSKTGERTHVKARVGQNAMYLGHECNIAIEGACEASLACCTCHVYVNQPFFDRLPQPKEEEEDMLDMAPFLKPNSRLSCQIVFTKELDGIELTLPAATRNFYVDGKTPTPH